MTSAAREADLALQLLQDVMTVAEQVVAAAVPSLKQFQPQEQLQQEEALQVLQETRKRMAVLQGKLTSVMSHLTAAPTKPRLSVDLFGLPGCDDALTPSGEAPLRELTLSPQQLDGDSDNASSHGGEATTHQELQSVSSHLQDADDEASIRYDLVVPVHRRCPGCTKQHRGHRCHEHHGQRTGGGAPQHKQQHGWLSNSVHAVLLPAHLALLAGRGVLWGVQGLVGRRHHHHHPQGSAARPQQQAMGGAQDQPFVRPSWFSHNDSFHERPCTHDDHDDASITWVPAHYTP